MTTQEARHILALRVVSFRWKKLKIDYGKLKILFTDTNATNPYPIILINI